MDEHALRNLLAHVKAGRLSRRAWLRMTIGLGLTAPMAAGMLAAAGVAGAQLRAPAFAPARRGGGGALRMLYWHYQTATNAPRQNVRPSSSRRAPRRVSRWS